MRILVDCRHLYQKNVSGVGEYTIQLLLALFALNKPSAGSGSCLPAGRDTAHSYVLLTTGKTKPDILSLFRERSNQAFEFPVFVKHEHKNQSNKFLNLRMLLMKSPALNWHTPDKIDLLFLPNLNITILPNNIPTILTIHDLSWKFFPEFYSKKMLLWHRLTKPQQLIQTSRQIITPSASTKRDVINIFHKSPESIQVIPHGIHPSFKPMMEARDHGVRSRLKLPKRFALFVGTIEPRKNVLSIIEGIKLYREKTGDDLHLVLAGKWGWKSHAVRRRLWRRDVADWIHDIGYINTIDRPALYRFATVFLWPSFYEGFGLPVLEAMACGLPVITSHTSALPELTATSAVLVDPFNVQDIADALRGVVQSKPLHDQLRKDGLEQAKKFTWERTAKETLKLFEMRQK